MSILPRDETWMVNRGVEEEEDYFDDDPWPTPSEAAAGALAALSAVFCGLSLAILQNWIPVRDWMINLDRAYFEGQAVLRSLHATVVCETVGLLTGLTLGLIGFALCRRSGWGVASAVAAAPNAMALIVVLAGWFVTIL